ncbi:hypothetical protein V1525DRAFT_125667 [Lipomyces kononenkoae]|uniref:Uncharacterized protein n=1 Tax=Lipomyces kononenkoae TaxID=34357 RepID=A0ACC3T3G9_LIPKO
MSEGWNGESGIDFSFSGDQSYESRRSASPTRVDSAGLEDTNDRPYNHDRSDDHPIILPSGERKEEPEGDRSLSLFVSGLDVQVTDAQFHTLFSQYGVVESCSIMRDPHTQESRGFGFVAFSDVEVATAAKNALQGTVIESKALQIEFARRNRPRTPTPGKYFGPTQQGRRDAYSYRGGRGGGYFDDRRSAARPRYDDRGSRPYPYGRADYRDRPARPDEGYRDRVPQRPYAEQRGGYHGRPGTYADRGDYERKSYPDYRERATYSDRRDYPDRAGFSERGSYDRRPDYAERRPPYDYSDRGYPDRVQPDRAPYPERGGYQDRPYEYDRPSVSGRGGYNDRGGYGRDRGDYRGSYPPRDGGVYRERYEERPPPAAIPSGPSRGYGEYAPESRAPPPPVRGYSSEYRYERH